MKTPTKQSTLQLFILQGYWIGLSFMWNSLHVTILPAVLLNYVPEMQKNTYLGLLKFAGLVMAMVIQPISGSFSDRWVSRWGRRRPLMVLGTLFDFLFLIILTWAGGLPWLFIGYVGLQISSNIAHGPAQGLMPDQVPPEQMGRASGIKNLMDMAGLVAASLLMGFLFDEAVLHPVVPMMIVMALLLVGAAITIIGVREQPSTAQGLTSRPIFEELKDSLKVDFRKHSTYAWLIVSRFAFLLGIYDIQAFAQYYVRDVIPVDDPVAITNFLLAAIALGLIGFSVLGGWLGDRFGHKRVLLAASLIGASGSLLMMAARTPLALLVFGSVLGAGVGLFLTSNWAIANDLAPEGETGKYLGLTNLATAGSAAVAQLAGPLIDLGNNARPGQFLGYAGMYVLGAVAILLSALLLKKITYSQPGLSRVAHE